MPLMEEIVSIVHLKEVCEETDLTSLSRYIRRHWYIERKHLCECGSEIWLKEAVEKTE